MPSSPDVSVAPRGVVPLGVADLLAIAAAESPEKLAIVEAAGRSLTWAQLDDEVSRLATGLGTAGIVAGHRVALAASNRLEFVTTYLAVLRVQAVAVPLNPRATGNEIGRMLADSGARIVVADDVAIEAVREAVGHLDHGPRVYVIGEPPAATPALEERSYDDLRATTAQPIPAITDPERLAVLLYTSGTSGKPRGAMLTHRALLANIDQISQVDPPMVVGDDVVLGVLPLFHVYGLNAVLGGVIRHRAKLLLVDRFDPQSTLDLIDDEACSVVPVAPPVVAYWMQDAALEERLGPVRLLLSGSAPLAPELITAFTERTGIPVHQGYGLTEAAPVVTSTLCHRGPGDPEPGSIGAPLPGIDVRLVDETGAEAEPGDPGEIQIRGMNLFNGYWPDASDGPGPDGWWATGDVGILAPAGDLFLVDRLKELVIVSGFNVYPVEVEETIAEVPGVADVAVIGVPDEQTGEAVVAYVVPDATAGADVAGLADEVMARCRDRLAGFKHPARIEIVEELPHTPTGKVQKGRLRNAERRKALGLLE